LVADSPLFREASTSALAGIQYWNSLEREEHVFVFTYLNYFELARRSKSRNLLQAQTFRKNSRKHLIIRIFIVW